jgi:PAS domain-containing protein
LLDSFSEALIVCDGDSRVRFLNLAAERVNRVSRQEVLGLSDSDFFQRSALSSTTTCRACAAAARAR